MFALNQFPGSNMGYSDVCTTMFSTMCYANFSDESLGAPAAYNLLVGCAPVHNMATTLAPSTGDESGISGVASGMIMGPDMSFVNSNTCLMGSLPTKRVSSTGVSNGTNTCASALTPNQLKVLVLSP